MTTALAILAIGAVFGAQVTGRADVPDVEPGDSTRLLRELVAGPLRLRIYERGSVRSLMATLATHAPAGRTRWMTIDEGGQVMEGNPDTLVIAVKPVDRHTRDILMIDVRKPTGTNGSAAIQSRYLVTRAGKHPRLVCHLPSSGAKGLEIAILEVAPSLVFSITSGTEQVRFVAIANDTCRLAPLDSSSTESPGDLLYNSIIAEALTFREIGRWREAGDAFQRALRLRPRMLGAEMLAREAVRMRSNYFDLRCWSNSEDLEEMPLDDKLRSVFESYDDYLSLFPATGIAMSVRFMKAGQLRSCNLLESAADLYKEVFQRYSDHEIKRIAREEYDDVLDLIQQRNRARSITKTNGSGPEFGPPNDAAAQQGVAADGAAPRR